MTGFLAALAAAVRKRPSELPGVPFDELEEMARRASGTRRDFAAAVRRSVSDNGERGPLRIVATLAGADPATDEIFDRLDPSGECARAAEEGQAAVAVYTEPDIHRGRIAWLESARNAAELPVLRLDWFFEPRAVLAGLTGSVDALLLDPSFLGRDSVNESLAIVREFGATGVLLVRDTAGAEVALEEQPPVVLMDRRDPDTLVVRPGIVDRLLEALEDYQGIRLVVGGIEGDAAIAAAGRRPIDGVLVARMGTPSL